MSETPAPPPAETPPPEEPRKRGWFVVLAWVTLVGFGIFTAAVTVLAFLIERFARR